MTYEQRMQQRMDDADAKCAATKARCEGRVAWAGIVKVEREAALEKAEEE